MTAEKKIAKTPAASRVKLAPRPAEGAQTRKSDHGRARIDTAIESEAEAILAAIGLTVSDATRLMLHRVVEERRLPFDPLIPNETTIAAIRASRLGEVTKVESATTLLAALDAD